MFVILYYVFLHVNVLQQHCYVSFVPSIRQFSFHLVLSYVFSFVQEVLVRIYKMNRDSVLRYYKLDFDHRNYMSDFDYRHCNSKDLMDSQYTLHFLVLDNYYYCMEVVDVIHAASGTSASYMKNPLERKLRDAHGAASHRWVAHPLYETLGGILFGLEPDAEFAGTGGPVLGGKKK